MSDSEVRFYPQLSFGQQESSALSAIKTSGNPDRLEPATCTEAEPFALQVRDDSMLPEFKRGCIIVIDPTGRATHGSFVLAKILSAQPEDDKNSEDRVSGFIFRQLRQVDIDHWQLHALNEAWHQPALNVKLDEIVGVVVQRAGTRRCYHKRYD